MERSPLNQSPRTSSRPNLHHPETQEEPQKKFEVIVGKSMAEDCDDRYLVRGQDANRKAPVCEMLRRQGLSTGKPVTVLTDGGDSVRALVADLPAGSEHHCFHVAMRMTGLGQYAKGATIPSKQPPCRIGWSGSSGGCGTATPTRPWRAPARWPRMSPPWPARILV